MRQNITIVKVGGAVVENPEQLNNLLDAFEQIAGSKVLVHGGGRLATSMAQRLGVETVMVEGRRVTDDRMLEVVTMVYGGLVNKQVVAKLQAKGVQAVGLTGADLRLMTSVRRPPRNGVDYGWVGDVQQVDVTHVLPWLKNGVVPVLAPLTHDAHGHLLNTNADTIAAEMAKELAKYADVTLVFAFEKPGVMANPDDDASVIERMDSNDFERLKADGTISGGMIPKVENALKAVEAGVKEVIITQANDIDKNTGTHIVPLQIRHA